MTTVEQALGDFIDAWNAGRRPDVREYLARVGATERDELARQLTTWLEVAPVPAYDAAARAAIAREPALLAALERADETLRPLAERLPELRARRGLGTGELGARIAALFGLPGADRATAYVERLERGELDAGRLSQRLLDALAAILRADRAQLAPGRAAIAPGGSLFRAGAAAAPSIADDIDALSRAALAPAPEPMDELDRLFLGGPGA
jgi:transcriptional regulator with XRE-family HTH domain